MPAAATNPWIGVTFIPDNVRMEVPPAYVLQRIYDFDRMLVLMPSRMVPFAYVIARRKERTAGLTDKAITDTATPDTRMCVQYGCVPVCLMYKTGATWNIDPVLRSLAARDIWAHGGADKYADLLEAQEAAAAAKLKQDIRDDQWNRSGDAYRSYLHRTGGSNLLSKQMLKPRSGRRTE